MYSLVYDLRLVLTAVGTIRPGVSSDCAMVGTGWGEMSWWPVQPRAISPWSVSTTFHGVGSVGTARSVPITVPIVASTGGP
jgi:hypothetical protein